MDNLVEQNKSNVVAFYDMAFNQKRPQEAIAKYVGSMYRQHNPMAGDGPQPFIAFVTRATTDNPKLKVSFKRVIGDADYVVTHAHITQDEHDRGVAAMDIFRLEDGKIVEHWDVLQPVPEQSANQNTMF